VLVISIAASVGALGWSVVFLALVQIIASILMTQVLHDYIMDPSNPLEVRKDVFAYFGRFSNSMLTMFETTLAPGAWSYIGRIIIFQVSPWYALFFVPYGWESPSQLCASSRQYSCDRLSP